jgi:hypothetical protein
VVLSSAAERIGNLDFNDLNFKGPRGTDYFVGILHEQLVPEFTMQRCTHN